MSDTPEIRAFLSSPANAGDWTLVSDLSSFRFKNKTMWGLVSVKGSFREFAGEGQIGGQGGVTGRIVIKAASLRTGIGQRDKHLRSADFFDADNHPDITITVDGVEETGGALHVRAELTIRGNTVALPMRVEADFGGDGTVHLTGTTTVEREQLGVSGDLLGSVGKTTTVSADAVFRRA